MQPEVLASIHPRSTRKAGPMKRPVELERAPQWRERMAAARHTAAIQLALRRAFWEGVYDGVRHALLLGATVAFCWGALHLVSHC